jgi:hypothetical protein
MKNIIKKKLNILFLYLYIFTVSTIKSLDVNSFHIIFIKINIWLIGKIFIITFKKVNEIPFT